MQEIIESNVNLIISLLYLLGAIYLLFLIIRGIYRYIKFCITGVSHLKAKIPKLLPTPVSKYKARKKLFIIIMLVTFASNFQDYYRKKYSDPSTLQNIKAIISADNQISKESYAYLVAPKITRRDRLESRLSNLIHSEQILSTAGLSSARETLLEYEKVRKEIVILFVQLLIDKTNRVQENVAKITNKDELHAFKRGVKRANDDFTTYLEKNTLLFEESKKLFNKLFDLIEENLGSIHIYNGVITFNEDSKNEKYQTIIRQLTEISNKQEALDNKLVHEAEIQKRFLRN